MSSRSKNNEIKKIESRMHTLCSYFQQGILPKYLISYYIEFIEKLQVVIGDYQSFNIDINEFDCIQRKMTEIADSNQECKDKLKDHLEKANDLIRNLNNKRMKIKFNQSSQVIKNYNDLRAKKVSSISCCGYIYRSSNNLFRHIKKDHGETFTNISIEIPSNQNQPSIRDINKDHGEATTDTSIKITSNQNRSSIRDIKKDNGETPTDTSIKITSNQNQSSKRPFEKDHGEILKNTKFKIPPNRNQIKRRITVYVI